MFSNATRNITRRLPKPSTVVSAAVGVAMGSQLYWVYRGPDYQRQMRNTEGVKEKAVVTVSQPYRYVQKTRKDRESLKQAEKRYSEAMSEHVRQFAADQQEYERKKGEYQLKLKELQGSDGAAATAANKEELIEEHMDRWKQEKEELEAKLEAHRFKADELEDEAWELKHAKELYRWGEPLWEEEVVMVGVQRTLLSLHSRLLRDHYRKMLEKQLEGKVFQKLRSQKPALAVSVEKEMRVSLKTEEHAGWALKSIIDCDVRRSEALVEALLSCHQSHAALLQLLQNDGNMMKTRDWVPQLEQAVQNLKTETEKLDAEIEKQIKVPLNERCSSPESQEILRTEWEDWNNQIDAKISELCSSLKDAGEARTAPHGGARPAKPKHFLIL